MKASRFVMAGMAGIALAASAQAAVNFGSANGYSVFATGNATFNGGGTQYGVAAGGNMTLTSISPGSSVTSGQNAVVVGGNLTMNGGGTAGAIYAGNNATVNSTSITGTLYAGKNAEVNGGNVAGGVYYGSGYSGAQYVQHQQSSVTQPISFNSAAAEFESYSSAFAGMASTGTVTSQWGGITLTGTSATTNVFSLDASIFKGAWGLTINAPTSSNIVINVAGNSANMQLSMNTSGISSSNIVLNFYEANSVTINSSTIYGTVLAAAADTTLNGGHLYGNVITNQFTSTSTGIDSLGYNNGAGISPAEIAGAIASVPEPATISVLGFTALALLHRPRRK